MKLIKRVDGVTRWLIVIVLITGLIAIVQHFLLITQHARSVLEYPEQRVLNHVTGTNGPSLTITDTLKVRATKCVKGTQSVEVSGNLTWVSQDPPGSVVDAGHGSVVRAPGCTTKIFDNPLPADVVRRTEEILKSTHAEFVTWRLTGTETPVDPTLQAKTWQTEAFDLYVTPPSQSS